MVRCPHLIGDRTARGFAVLKADGGVVCWGHPSYGGDSRAAAGVDAISDDEWWLMVVINSV